MTSEHESPHPSPEQQPEHQPEPQGAPEQYGAWPPPSPTPADRAAPDDATSTASTPTTGSTPTTDYSAPGGYTPTTGYQPPTYDTPTYNAPTYSAPTYSTPSYSAPTYGTPSHDAPSYSGPTTGAAPVPGQEWHAPHGAPAAATYGAPAYGTQGYTAPGYGAPYSSNPYGAGGYGGTPYGTTPEPAGPKGRGGSGRTILIAAVVAAVVAAGVGAGVGAAVSTGSSSNGALSVTSASAPSPKVDGSIAAAAAAISPSVVTINVAAGGNSGAGGTGSGMVIKTDGTTGYILTNNHVVTLDSQTKASSNTITVTLNNGNNVDASVVGTDPSDDLAVVKVSAPNLTAATFAKSSALTVGQTVVAMGAPLGLSNTVTSGIVSAVARPVDTGSSQNAAIFNAIQTDAAINPGNSGGPLVDLAGHVVGVNSAIAGTGSGSSGAQSGNIGIGFAIPSDEASRIASQLIANGKATHAVLGITVNSSDQQNTGPTAGTGATVASVQAGSPAAKAGIAAGDVITKIGDQRIDDSIGAIAATRAYAPGSTVQVTLNSKGTSKTVSVTLGSATDS